MVSSWLASSGLWKSLVDFYSQEVELFGKRLESTHLFYDLRDPGVVSAVTIFSLLIDLGETDVRVELRNFVTILARCRDLDWSCPVEVEVTKRKGQVLYVKLTKLGFVHSAEEMSGQNTSLSSVSRRKVEVKYSFFGLRSFLLDQFLIDDASWRGVDQASSWILNEESLGDSLVHNDNCDFWRRQGVVKIIDSCTELRNFLI